MSTANFKDMEYNMPLVTGGLRSYDEMKALYKEESGEEYSEVCYYFDMEDEFRNAKELAENFTEDLKYHNVEVVSGYYLGFQFWVEEKYSNEFDLDKSSKYCIDNDDAKYYFDVYRSVALKEADREKRKIAKWLESLAKNGSFEILVCVGRFSNGEVVYSIKTPRTALLSAVV